MGQPFHILCATDDKYAPYFGIMLTSLFENNPNSRFIVHFLVGKNLSEQTQIDFLRLSEKYQQCICYIKVDDSLLAECPIRIGDHVTLATYYRLLAPALLPDDVETVLYLDGDIIINGPLNELFALEMSGKAIAASIDESYKNYEVYERLNLRPAIPYTSAGVLLINLRYWRDHNVMNRCLDCISRMADKLLFHDQDTLNVVLENEKLLLPPVWNFQQGYLRPWLFGSYDPEFRAEIMNVINNPIIIHYSGPAKPWFKHNDHPFRSYFLFYKKLSLWKDVPLTGVYKMKDFFRYVGGKLLRLMDLKQDLYIIPPKEKKI